MATATCDYEVPLAGRLAEKEPGPRTPSAHRARTAVHVLCCLLCQIMTNQVELGFSAMCSRAVADLLLSYFTEEETQAQRDSHVSRSQS